MMGSDESGGVESKSGLSKESPQAAAAPAPAGPAEPEESASRHENLFLVGRPSLKQYLRYVASHAVEPASSGVLADQWRSGLEVVRQLEKEEADLADDPPIRKLGPEYKPLLIELLRDPLVRGNFNTVPTDIALVELDRLVVCQKHIDLTYARELERRIGPAPTEEQIFRTCLPHDHPRAPVKWSRVHRDHFVFMSASNDLRSLGVMPLEPRQLKDCPLPGDVVGIVGIAIGFGTNFLNAVYMNKRLVLNNGSHRAYALRRLGVTHVPCIVQHVSTKDELQVVGPVDLRSEPNAYLKEPRPAMLRDYFDPRLHQVMWVHHRLRQVTVSFEVEENSVPAL